MSLRSVTVPNFELVRASMHVIYGASAEKHQFEANALSSYSAWLTETFEGAGLYFR